MEIISTSKNGVDPFMIHEGEDDSLSSLRNQIENMKIESSSIEDLTSSMENLSVINHESVWSEDDSGSSTDIDLKKKVFCDRNRCKPEQNCCSTQEDEITDLNSNSNI